MIILVNFVVFSQIMFFMAVFTPSLKSRSISETDGVPFNRQSGSKWATRRLVSSSALHRCHTNKSPLEVEEDEEETPSWMRTANHLARERKGPEVGRFLFRRSERYFPLPSDLLLLTPQSLVGYSGGRWRKKSEALCGTWTFSNASAPFVFATLSRTVT